MPPWLLELLKATGSVGMVDSLSQLSGVTPDFNRVKALQPLPGVHGAPVARVTQTGDKPTINITDQLFNQFAQPLPKGYRGSDYKPVDPNQKFGDTALQHEFGHVAIFTMTQPEVLDGFFKAYPGADGSESEKFADSFQNAFQFLRSGERDLTKLDDKTQLVAKALLKHPLYSQHPINEPARQLQQFINFLTGK